MKVYVTTVLGMGAVIMLGMASIVYIGDKGIKDRMDTAASGDMEGYYVREDGRQVFSPVRDLDVVCFDGELETLSARLNKHESQAEAICDNMQAMKTG